MTEVVAYVHGPDGDMVDEIYLPEGGSLMIEGRVVWEDGSSGVP